MVVRHAAAEDTECARSILRPVNGAGMRATAEKRDGKRDSCGVAAVVYFGDRTRLQWTRDRDILMQNRQNAQMHSKVKLPNQNRVWCSLSCKRL